MSKRDDIRNVQLNLLIELDNICKKNNIKYYLAFGTCLGALRHKGFIPWDDDIDVMMMIDEFDKLVGHKDDLDKRFFLQSRYTEKNYASIAARLRDSETTCIEEDDINDDINHGIYIDIYPFYFAPKTKIGLIENIFLSHIYKILVARRPPKNHGKLIIFIAKIILFFIPDSKRERVICKIDRILRKPKDGKYILDYFGQDISLASAITYPKEWFGEPRETEFENKNFPVPCQAEKYMSKRYGDYMTLPPENERRQHHSTVIIDPYKSYKEYEVNNK